MTTGRLNRLLGWLLLTVTFLASAALDGWSLSFRDPDELRASHALFSRHAQAVALGMAFFQLLVGLLLSRLQTGTANARLAAPLTMAGSLLYTIGYGLWVIWPPGAFVAAAGAILNSAGMFCLLPGRFPSALGWAPRVAVVVLCGGMLLDLAMALAAAPLGLPLPTYALDPESVQMRMLRLARAAMIALPLLATLYAEALERSRPVPRALEWAGLALVFGAATMSLNLVLAAGVRMEFKYLLGAPANAAVAGILAGALLAFRRAAPFDLIGWLFVLLGTTVGLFMGLYAFDGPFPTPDFLGTGPSTYNEYGRRVSRLAHAYVIIFGLILLNLQRDLPKTEHVAARLLIVAGALWSLVLAVLMVAGAAVHENVSLAVGTLAVGIGLAFCLPSLFRAARDAPAAGSA